MNLFIAGAFADNNRWRRIITVTAIALCLAYAYYIHLVPRQTLGLGERLGIALYLAAFFFAVAYLALHLVASRLRLYERRAQILWVLSCLGVGVLLVVVIPLRPPVEAARHMVEIAATGQKSPQAQGSEAWLYGISQDNAPMVPYSAFTADASWAVKDGALLNEGTRPAIAHWQGTLEPGAQLRFLAHPWSGIVRITIDDVPQTVDLYNVTPTTRTVAVSTTSGAASPSLFVRNTLLYIADVCGIAGLLLTSGLAIVLRSSGNKASLETARWPWLIYALPCIGVWLIYLLAFWPGMMSPDSLDQWEQARSSHFIDHHPAPHTMVIWLVMHIWPSPAAMALLQIVALAVVFGFTMSELERWGVPTWVRIVLTALFCLAPVNAAMTITLWKDVLYSIAMMAVFSLLLRVVRTRGAWLQPWRNRALLALLLAAVALFRHNGLPLAVFVLATAFVLLSAHRWRIGTVGLLWALIYLVVRGGVYSLVGVEPMSRAFSLYYSVHQVAAFVHSGVPLSEQDKAFLSQMQPLERWRDDYTCYGGDPTFWSKPFDHAFLQAHADAFTGLWLRLIREHPEILVRHLFCINSINWRIIPAPDSYMYVVQNGIAPNTFGLEQHALLPQLTPPLQGVLGWFHRTGQGWIWRPALYFYLTLFAVVICALRRRDSGVLLLAAISIGNIAVMMLLTPAQDLRYQYGVVMIGMIAPALLWAAAAPQTKLLMS